jgi:hypothetical protein
MEKQHAPTAFQPPEHWPLQETYKRRLHEKIQRWGELVAPIVEVDSPELTVERIHFFQFVVEAVPRDDRDTATLIQNLQNQMLEMTRSMYTDRLGTLSPQLEMQMSQHNFESLFAIYHAGRTA